MGGDGGAQAYLSIGALSRATGIPVDTLRTWETRYGWPVPSRKPSGHRVYPVATVARLQRVAAALARGHRASNVLPANDDALAALLGEAPGLRSDPVPPAGPRGKSALGLLAAATRFDAEAIGRTLVEAWARLGPLAFLREEVIPIVAALDEAWEVGALEVRHERFLTERVQDVLRSLRLPFDFQARGPLAVLAALAGDRHGLGLQMAALVLAVAGWRVRSLGVDVPLEEVASAAAVLRPRAVAVGISGSRTADTVTGELAALRAQLPAATHLLVGGQGVPKTRDPGVELIADMDALDAWARRQRVDA